jgi:hypothetical protein
MVQGFESEATATVLYAVWHPSLERVTLSSAGHYPPVLVSPGRPPDFLDIAPDPLIGWGGAASRQSTTVPIPPDGLFGLSLTVSWNDVANRSTPGSPNCARQSSSDTRTRSARP